MQTRPSNIVLSVVVPLDIHLRRVHTVPPAVRRQYSSTAGSTPSIPQVVQHWYTSYHGCFDKGINNGGCQKYETGCQIDLYDQQRGVTTYMAKMLVGVLLRFVLPVLFIVIGRVPQVVHHW